VSLSDEPIVFAEAEHLPHVESPYQGQKIGVQQHLAISAYWFATNFLWGALLVIILPAEVKRLVPEYRTEALGLLTGAAAVVALIVPLIAGALSDRCFLTIGRRRPYIAAGVAINIIGLGMMWLAYEAAARSIGTHPPPQPGLWAALTNVPGLLFFFVAYLVVQFGNNVASAAFSGVIPDIVPEEQRGAASGFMALMTNLGTLCGAVGSGLFLKDKPEWMKYALISVVLAGVTAVTLFGIKENPLPYRPRKIRWGPYLRSLWISPKEFPDFAWVWITRALVMLGFYSVLPFVNYYLVDVIHLDKPEEPAAKLIGILLVASAISGVAGGHISDRIGRKKVVYIANMTIAIMVLGFIFCRNLNHVLLAGIFFGLGFGAYTSVDWAMGTDVLPSKSNAAKEMAVWHIAMTLPQAIAAPTAGFLIGVWGKTEGVLGGEKTYHYTTTGYAAVFILCAVCFALGAYFLKNVRGVR
jgi:MFS family permease